VRCRFWHGGPVNKAPDQVRASPIGTHEYGQGIYLTSALSTALKYARGGALWEVEFRLPERGQWLQDRRLSRNDCLSFLKSRSRLRNRAAVIKDVLNWTSTESGDIPAQWFVNSCVDHKALGGEHGPALAKWLVDLGIKASLLEQPGGEQWVILFDAALVCSAVKRSRSERALSDWKLLEPSGPAASRSTPRCGLIRRD
jgi:hypothetical protein